MSTADEFKILQQLHDRGALSDEEFATASEAEREKRAAVMAMISRAEGKPAVHVDGRDGSVFVCRRVSGLRLALDECTFYGWCEWVDPPEARPDELSDGEAISYPDCLDLGPGWWYDAYFDWYMVYDPALVAQSLAGDHSWVPAFLESVSRDRSSRCI